MILKAMDGWTESSFVSQQTLYKLKRMMTMKSPSVGPGTTNFSSSEHSLSVRRERCVLPSWNLGGTEAFRPRPESFVRYGISTLWVSYWLYLKHPSQNGPSFQPLRSSSHLPSWHEKPMIRHIKQWWGSTWTTEAIKGSTGLYVMFIEVPRSERLISSSGLILVASNVSVHTMVPALSHICLERFLSDCLISKTAEDNLATLQRISSQVI